jgi:hypothetical protein
VLRAYTVQRTVQCAERQERVGLPEYRDCLISLTCLGAGPCRRCYPMQAMQQHLQRLKQLQRQRRSSSGSLASACNFVKAQSMSSMQKDVTVAMRPDRHRTVLSEPECRADRRLLPPAGARLSV